MVELRTRVRRREASRDPLPSTGSSTVPNPFDLRGRRPSSVSPPPRTGRRPLRWERLRVDQFRVTFRLWSICLAQRQSSIRRTRESTCAKREMGELRYWRTQPWIAYTTAAEVNSRGS